MRQLSVDPTRLHGYPSVAPHSFDLRRRRHKRPLDTSHMLSVAVTPVVLISACGLVTLALDNR